MAVWWVIGIAVTSVQATVLRSGSSRGRRRSVRLRRSRPPRRPATQSPGVALPFHARAALALIGLVRRVLDLLFRCVLDLGRTVASRLHVLDDRVVLLSALGFPRRDIAAVTVHRRKGYASKNGPARAHTYLAKTRIAETRIRDLTRGG